MSYKWRYHWQYRLAWFPIQPCLGCKRWFWGGLPFKNWRAAYRVYCCRDCYEECEYE